MATLVFGAIGTALGGPLGGAIGALVGRQVDSAIIGSPSRKGPRLKELEATTSSYGAALPRLFGVMRVPGTIIWATDLVEHEERQGGGKKQPSVTTYNYSASFAVALASRPIADIGRIWADGNLLRGVEGDLKVGGTMRVHHGYADQNPDPLIRQIEAPGTCPAFRGIAYVVFDDLELGDFYNRIPALTFEVIGTDGTIALQDIVGEVIDEVEAPLPLDRIGGLAMDGAVAETLRDLAPMFPVDVDAGGARLTFARERLQIEPPLLPEPAVSVDDGDFGGVSGFARKRRPEQQSPPEVLRYYDIDRDYLPGLQRSAGRPVQGQPQTVEIPAALTAADARILVERIGRRFQWQRQQIVWRTSELDPQVAPGAVVRVPGQAGKWRVEDWEWRERGIELTLGRVVPSGIGAPLSGSAGPIEATDSGRLIAPIDQPSPPTTLVAFELPWDGTGSGDAPATFAAVSSASSAWAGAALFADHGDGELDPLGPSGRTRSVTGVVENALPAGSPHLFDRQAAIIVRLSSAEWQLTGATGRQLAFGGNRALAGSEIVQFASAVSLGFGRWRLTGLLRGRGGTEAGIIAHSAGEAFVLLDHPPVSLDPAVIGDAPGTEILAIGRGDADPVVSAIALQGVTRRPLSPVHGRTTRDDSEATCLAWTRRARGEWAWRDAVEVPLREESETYDVAFFRPDGSRAASWTVQVPRIDIAASQIDALLAAAPDGQFRVRQQGTHALSPWLELPLPTV